MRTSAYQEGTSAEPQSTSACTSASTHLYALLRHALQRLTGISAGTTALRSLFSWVSRGTGPRQEGIVSGVVILAAQ